MKRFPVALGPWPLALCCSVLSRSLILYSVIGMFADKPLHPKAPCTTSALASSVAQARRAEHNPSAHGIPG